MKGRNLKLICSIGLVLVLLASILLVACAPAAAPTPGAPTRIKPQIPEQKQQAPITVTPTVPKAATPATPAPAPAAEVIKWKFADHMARDADRSRAVQIMLAMIEDMSDGRLEFQYFGAAELMATSELADALTVGIVDMEYQYGGYWSGILGEIGNMETGVGVWLPMEMNRAYVENSGFMDVMRRAYADVDVYYLGPVPLAGWGDNVYSTKKLDSPADMVGLPFRTSGVTSKILTKLGAATVWLAWEELYTALQMGTVEACEWGNFSLMWGMGLQDVAPYWYKVNIGSGGYTQMLAHLPSWDALPADIQVMMEVAHWATTELHSSIVIHDDNAVMAEIEAAVEVTDWTGELDIFKVAWKEVMDDMGASGDKYTKELYDLTVDYRTYLGEWPD